MSARGSLLGVRGTVLQLALPEARLGERLRLGETLVEVVGFDGVEAVALPLTPLGRVASGDRLRSVENQDALYAGHALLGRVVDALGQPIDGGASLPEANWARTRPAPEPLSRRPVHTALPLGVRVIDGLCTLGAGQRIALEAGPGAGKSTLLRQIAARAAAEVVVIGLIGERGREIGDFLRRLTPETRARSVVVVARADDPPLAWLRAAETVTAIAERFREEARSVLLLVDSLTRVARAVRTVGVAAGEPTTRRGFPPSLSTIVPALLERAANDAEGTLTAVYSVLVEGEASEDPVAEEARALLDGHIVLDPALAGAGHFPAVSVGRSVSRCMSDIAEHAPQANALRGLVAALERNRDLIAIGAYQRGADPVADRALARRERIDAFLRQGPDEHADYAATVEALAGILR